MSRKQFSKKDIKEFLASHSEAEDVMTKKSDVVQVSEMLYVNGTLSYIYVNERWVPSLVLLQVKPTLLPRVTVDKGAIKFVVNGADVMRPGITAAEEFDEGDVVTVVDETMGKPIAVCKTLHNSHEILKKDSGKVLETLHHISDTFWEQKNA
ncbi:MAG: PUA domain-containing protein [Nanobdellota archaeon]